MEKVLRELVKQHGDKLDLSNGNEYHLILNNGTIVVKDSGDGESVELAVTVFKAGKPHVFHVDADVREFIPTDAE